MEKKKKEKEEIKPKTNEELVEEICSALSQILDVSPRPEFKDGVFAKVGVSSGKELQTMMDKKLRSIFRLLPRESIEGEVTAYAPGMEVQPGEKEREEKSDNEWGSDSEQDEFRDTEDDFRESEEDFPDTDNDCQPDALRDEVAAVLMPMLARQPPPGSGWSTPPLYRRSDMLVPPPSFPPLSTSAPPPTVHGKDDEREFDSSPPHSPKKMPRLERVLNPDPEDSEEWHSADDATRRRVAAPPPPPATPLPTASPYPRPGSPAPWSAPHSALPRRILGELPLAKDEFASSEESDGEGPSPTVSIPHHPNLPRPPTAPPHGAPLEETIPNDENAPQDRPETPSSVFSPMTLGTAPPPSLALLANNVFARSSPHPSPLIEFNPFPPDYQDDPDFDSDSD